MFYGNTPQDTRQLFYSSWNKYQLGKPLSDLERQISSVILDHPEFHHTMDNSTLYMEHTYFPELGDTNPFLHMGLHLAIREQIHTNRPQGIQPLFEQLLIQFKDNHEVEHLMMEQLADCLWTAQKNNSLPDEQAYLEKIRLILE